MPSDVAIVNHAHDENEPCTSECRTPSGESVIHILDDRAVEEMQAQLDRCAIIATIKSLRAQADEIVEREAACCPEDVGFDEYIRSLQSQLEQLRAEVQRLKSERDRWKRKYNRIDIND